MTDINTSPAESSDTATMLTATGLSGSNVEGLALSHIPCCKNGPSQEMKALAKRVSSKLKGTLRDAFTDDRVCCASQVTKTTLDRGLPRRAAVIALDTTIVESTILNVTGGDRDSVGLFQQRASWGSVAQRMDPKWATNAFLDAMLRAYPKGAWLTAPIGEVCQKVQVSAFPSRYQPQADDAAAIVYALAPTSTMLAFGDTGPEIVALQKALAQALKQTLSADGVFGPATREAVMAFQRREKLEVDGVAGPKTRAALRKVAPAVEAALPEQVGGPVAEENLAEVEGTEAQGMAMAESVASASGVRINPGVTIGPVGRRLVSILAHYPKKGELYVTSGYRVEKGSYHMGRPYKGSPAAAIDFAADGGLSEAGLVRMRDAAKWLYDNFADLTVELIHSTPFKDDRGFYVKNQVKDPGGDIYGEALRLQHRNHVHFATSEALAAKIMARLGTK